jgi:hypothetical protein
MLIVSNYNVRKYLNLFYERSLFSYNLNEHFGKI